MQRRQESVTLSTRKASNERLIVAKVLSLTPQEMDSIEVVDTEGNLVMVHYKQDANLANPKIAHVRGTVIDVVRQYIVCPGLMFVPAASNNELVVGEDGTIKITDQFDIDHTFDLSKTTFSTFVEGVYIRCFLYNDKFYEVTNKNLNPREKGSRWSDHGMHFTTMKDENGGPDRYDLYLKGAKESPYTFVCYIVHPSLNLTVQSGFAQSITIIRENPLTWSEESSPFTAEEIGYGEPAVPTEPKGRFASPEELSLQEANHMLAWGYSAPYQRPVDDLRYGTGESIFVTLHGDNGAIIDRVHVKSSAYAFREELFSSVPNNYMTFVYKTGLANLDMKKPEDRRKLGEAITLYSYNYEQEVHERMALPSMLPGLPVTPEQSLVTFGRAELLRLVWFNFLVHSSVYYRLMAFRYLMRFEKDVKDLKNWLSGISGSAVLDVGTGRSAARVKAILGLADRKFSNKNRGGWSREATSQQKQDLYKKIIGDIVDNELPTSLYQLIKLMRSTTQTSSLYITEPETLKREEPSLPVSLKNTAMISSAESFPAMPSTKSGVVDDFTAMLIETPNRADLLTPEEFRAYTPPKDATMAEHARFFNDYVTTTLEKRRTLRDVVLGTGPSAKAPTGSSRGGTSTRGKSITRGRGRGK